MINLPVAIGLSPNTGRDDYVRAFKTLIQPWKWKQGESIQEVEDWFKNYFSARSAVAFNAGRSGLLAILTAFGIGSDDEVLVQAFTCVAVPNSVLWAGAQPVFVDIDASLNIEIADAQKKITPHTKALIVQHTFGIPADMEKIVSFCKKHKIVLIEDCAHALGARYKGKLVGTFGDAAFFSFGRDKIISSVFGGIVITNNKIYSTKITQYFEQLKYPSYFWILQQLLHPLVLSIVLPTYTILNFGKALLWFFQQINLLSLPVYKLEKIGKQPRNFPQKYPNALAQLLLIQLQKLEQMNTRRREIAEQYFTKLSAAKLKLPEKMPEAVYLRFNVITTHADQLRFQAKKQKVLLGNWYTHLIDPKGTDCNIVGYESGSCPNAERIAQLSLNLPTYERLTQKQIQQIINLLNKVEGV